MVDCVYCKYIKPDLKGSKFCPECHGNTPTFKAMRMMDRTTSEQELLYSLLNMQFNENYEKLRTSLLNLLTQVDIYNFDMKSALINYLQINEPLE
ncbi:hypothetical protein NEF87_003243 [Candidatus Lokiarchaeum ossiferum]|uniref:Uncharacterized protein n=1 Tax=Candidatus Lokiarchaeum ossiferum TaxID=2951803 RepID=A0ABY6HTW0_9ARCH|nr:hypothetical protein NEF87_003243 [Candidatus Lokiarchaeum sp. B-35]